MNAAEVEDGSVAAVSVDLRSSQVETFCNATEDPRIAVAVVELAQGRTLKQAANACGITRITLWRLCQQYPIEAMAAAEAEARAKGALLRLTAHLDAAAEVLCDHVTGAFDAENIESERLRQSAAKTTLSTVLSVLDRHAAKAAGLPVTASAGKEIPTNELIRRAMEMRRLGKGGKP